LDTLPIVGYPDSRIAFVFIRGIFIMKKIELSKINGSKNKGKYFAMVDDENYDYLNQFNWCLNNGYASRYEKINGKYKNVQMHRQIMNTPKGMHVDHKDHNRLNNQKTNLRNCKPINNYANRRMNKKCVVKYIGVSIHNNNGYKNKYRADVSFNRNKYFLGTFDTPLEAALAYDQRAKELKGEYANLNFP
jgi:hypothetical protein